MGIRVCVAGATGWTSRAVTAAILASSEFQLVGAIARRQVGRDIGEALDHGSVNLNIVASLSPGSILSPNQFVKTCCTERKSCLASYTKQKKTIE